MKKKEILLVGGTISRNLDKFISDKTLGSLNNVLGHEYRFYSLCKVLLENFGNFSVAISKDSNSSLSGIEAPIHVYRKKLWSEDLERVIKDYQIIIFSDRDYYGLPTLLYNRKKVLVDLWNIDIRRPKTKKAQFYYDFLSKPMLNEIQKRSSAILYVADLQRVLFPNRTAFKISFSSLEGVEESRGDRIVVLNDERRYEIKLKEFFQVATCIEPAKVAISFAKNYLFYNWKLATLIDFGIPIISDRRNMTIKELKRTGLAFGCDSTKFDAVVGMIKKISSKKLKKKNVKSDCSKFVRFINAL